MDASVWMAENKDLAARLPIEAHPSGAVGEKNYTVYVSLSTSKVKVDASLQVLTTAKAFRIIRPVLKSPQVAWGKDIEAAWLRTKRLACGHAEADLEKIAVDANLATLHGNHLPRVRRHSDCTATNASLSTAGRGIATRARTPSGSRLFRWRRLVAFALLAAELLEPGLQALVKPGCL